MHALHKSAVAAQLLCSILSSTIMHRVWRYISRKQALGAVAFRSTERPLGQKGRPVATGGMSVLPRGATRTLNVILANSRASAVFNACDNWCFRLGALQARGGGNRRCGVGHVKFRIHNALSLTKMALTRLGARRGRGGGGRRRGAAADAHEQAGPDGAVPDRHPRVEPPPARAHRRFVLHPLVLGVEVAVRSMKSSSSAWAHPAGTPMANKS